MLGWRGLVDFLRESQGVSEADARRLRGFERNRRAACRAAFREAVALRTVIGEVLLAIEAGRAVEPTWADALNQALSAGLRHEELAAGPDGWTLRAVPGRTGPRAALAPIARSAAELIVEGPGAPIRKCRNPTCALYFYDASPTARRRWCSMAVCGNRMKVAAFARRQAGRTAEPPPAAPPR